MRYHNITKNDMNNGVGLRVVLWVSGCSHHCSCCQNPITWDAQEGLEFDSKAKEEIFAELENDYVDGITLSGGDPLFKDNEKEIIKLIEEIKSKYPQKSIWLYTGYTFEELSSFSALKLINVICDGKFMIELLNNELHWVGSSNQRVIDVQKSLKENKVVLFQE